MSNIVLKSKICSWHVQINFKYLTGVGKENCPLAILP